MGRMMSDDRYAAGRAALAAALEKAARHSTAAAVAAALVPLASFAFVPPAEAGLTQPPTITLKETNIGGGVTQYDYTVTDPIGGPGIITDIVIPEVRSHTFNPDPVLLSPKLDNPAGWNAFYNSPASNITAGGKQVLNPLEFVHLQVSGGVGISPGDAPVDFILESDFQLTLDTTFQVGLNNSDLSTFVLVDPPTPDPGTTAAPEPGTLTLLGGGLAGFGLWWRRRRK